MSRIPKGSVSTYKDIAKAAGVKNPRVVGFALHQNKNPHKVPCHRVVLRTGHLANGYVFGGAKAQEEKLRKEGVAFLSKNRVNLAKSLTKLLPNYVP